MPHPPFRPNYIQAVNYVIDVWAQPCEAPWYIYAETLGPAALEALITLATFGWDDVFRGYVRPKALRGRRAGKRPLRIRGVPIRFPELGELIGRKLPGQNRMATTKYSSPTKSLWRIDGTLQRGMFYWLLADIAVDFSFNWSSALYATEWCAAENVPRHSNVGRPFQLGVAGWTWHELNCPVEQYGDPGVSFAVHTWTFGPWHFVFGGAAIFFDHILQGGRCQIRLVRLPLEDKIYESEIGYWEPGDMAKIFASGTAHPGEQWRVDWRADTPSGLVKIDERYAFAFHGIM